MPEGKQEMIAARTQTNQVGLDVQQRQRRQMLIATAILLLALILVMLKDWHVWFSPTPTTSIVAEPLERSIVVPDAPANPLPAKASQTVTQKNNKVSAASHTVPTAPAIIASDRAVLPPLEVEVVAGSRHRSLPATSNSVRVDMQSEAVAPQVVTNEGPISNASAGPVVQASETMHLSQSTSEVVSRSVEPDYPMLAKQMKVQGSVVLQALIGRSGNIEDLRVLSGPSILSSAAMQAVKQWRFRPYYLSGAAVETQARITVNFTISTN
jgi:protein TonB